MVTKANNQKWLFLIAVFGASVVATCMFVLPALGSTSMQVPPGVTPQHNFWPLPPVGQQYWWVFKWFDGGQPVTTPCSPNGDKKVGIWATYFEKPGGLLGDGAFQREYLLSINLFKDDPCSYWRPGYDQAWRWYSRGFVQVSNGVQDIFTGERVKTFLSFRGDSRWCPDRSANNIFKSGSSSLFTVNGTYTTANTCPGGTHPFSEGWRVGRNDGIYLPIYGLLSDRPFNANTLTTNSSVGPNENYIKFPGGAQGWSDQRNCGPTSPTCTGSTVYPDVAWFATWRAIPTSAYTFQGKQVQYVGQSETPVSGGDGACEEWWYAEDIGPIYVAKYPRQSLASCMMLLNGTHLGGFLNDPLQQINRTRGSMIGYLAPASLTPPNYSWCLNGNCKVENQPR